MLSGFMNGMNFYESKICSGFASKAIIFQDCPRLLGVYLSKPEILSIRCGTANSQYLLK